MTRFVPITVEARASSRADETPTVFFWGTERFEVREIVDRWYQGARDPTVRVADYFKVRTADGRLHIIMRDGSTLQWWLMQR